MAQHDQVNVDQPEDWAVALRREQLRNDPSYKEHLDRLRRERQDGTLPPPVAKRELDEFWSSILGP
ncbi:MAG: hypothetical protein ACREJF_09140 [Candidatus Methylomirabilales bacterium]